MMILITIIFNFTIKMSKLFFGIKFPKKEKQEEAPQFEEFCDNKFDRNIEYFEQLNDKSDDKEIRKYTSFIYDYLKKNSIVKKGKNIKLPLTTFESIQKHSNLDPRLTQLMSNIFHFE